MNTLIENKYLSEIECGNNFSLVLSENNLFLSTEYKVLQSSSNSCFVRCMKMTYNGNVQLYYLTNGLKKFSSLIPTIDAESFLVVVSNLLSDILEVKSIGFLSCQNIDVSFERIYVDPTTYKVSLVYLPLGKRIYDDVSSFENELRTGLIKLISGISTLSSPKTMQFVSDLSDGTLSVEDLYARVKGGKISKDIRSSDKPQESSGVLRIVAMNTPERVEVVVNKDEFVIGKKPELCDGVVSFNKMISRSHCKVYKRNGQFLIMDLQSANGTYVNNSRVQPNQFVPLNNGDIIRLANSDFQVIIR